MAKYSRKQEIVMRGAVTNIQKKLNFSDEDISKILGYKDREEYKKNKELSEYAIERSITLTGIVTGLMGLKENDFEAITRWFDTENKGLRKFLGESFQDKSSKPLKLMSDYPFGLDLVDAYVLEVRGLR